MNEKSFFYQNVLRRSLIVIKSASYYTAKSKKLLVGTSILSSLILVAIFEPIINGVRLGGLQSSAIGYFPRLQMPSQNHPLGTDHFGRDVFAMLITGIKNSLIVGFLVGFVAVSVALVVSLFAAYKGGTIDNLLNSLTNVILILPSWAIAAAAVAYIQRLDITLVALIIASFAWAGPARQIRSQVLSLKSRPYIDLAKMVGERDSEIIFFEILPNILPYIIVGFSYAVIGGILAETGLRLIGLGAAEVMTLGLLIHIFMTSGLIIQGYYHFIIGPVISLILIFISLNLINIGLDELFNPRLKKVTGE
ncbi:Putative peptide transport permease protein [Candidatus Calditenuaceae archaeon HR02]|nr:Putative peptide transport permease protein [Candidatus Calditenuaceae archaeon HR02]